jgi:hypothetical protein
VCVCVRVCDVLSHASNFDTYYLHIKYHVFVRDTVVWKR